VINLQASVSAFEERKMSSTFKEDNRGSATGVLLESVLVKKADSSIRMHWKHKDNQKIQPWILNGNRMGQKVAIPRIPITSPEDGTLPVVFERCQFPVKPAFAITINKSQGQTLQSIGVYLPQSVFTHGQLYVALSRCSSRTKTNVLIKNGALPGLPGTYTRNIVFPEVL
jgi:ATP-dependent DNA helicase PIF1